MSQPDPDELSPGERAALAACAVPPPPYPFLLANGDGPPDLGESPPATMTPVRRAY